MIGREKEEIPPQREHRNEDWAFRNDHKRLTKQMGGVYNPHNALRANKI